ncbi:MAG TPA: hypothetical protein VK902_10310 [Rubrobacter sp.]|jgi:hypothetical protein|nr:hypothetical protein [Rubrobacter sp.]
MVQSLPDEQPALFLAQMLNDILPEVAAHEVSASHLAEFNRR